MSDVLTGGVLAKVAVQGGQPAVPKPFVINLLSADLRFAHALGEQLSLFEEEAPEAAQESLDLSAVLADGGELLPPNAQSLPAELAAGSGQTRTDEEELPPGRNALFAGAAVNKAGAAQNAPPELELLEPRMGESRDKRPVEFYLPDLKPAAPATAGATGEGRNAALNTAIYSGTIEPDLQDNKWGQASVNQLVWQADQNVQQARLQLNPPELGPIEVHMSVSDEQATIQFSTHHTVVKEAIESALPKLREMLSDAGLNLAHADVSDHAERRQQNPGSGIVDAGTPEGAPLEQTRHAGPIGFVHEGLVDTFA